MKTLLINPPPRDYCCECCGRHISELQPFGAAGDPLVGDFNGALLLKMYRSMLPHSALDSYVKKGYLTPDMSIVEEKINELSDEELSNLEFGLQLVNTVGASWECRDCIVLDSEDFYDRLDRVSRVYQNC